MQTIKVYVENQQLKITQRPLVASGGMNETEVEFEFSEAWEGFTKTALFYTNPKEFYEVELDENNKCLIPNEVVLNKGKIYFGVYGESEDKRLTSNVVEYKIEQGAYLVGTNVSKPNFYEEMKEAMLLLAKKENVCNWEQIYIMSNGEEITLTENTTIILQAGVEEVSVHLNGFKLFLGNIGSNQSVYFYNGNEESEDHTTLYNFGLVKNNIDGCDSTYLALYGSLDNIMIEYDKNNNIWDFQHVNVGNI